MMTNPWGFDPYYSVAGRLRAELERLEGIQRVAVEELPAWRIVVQPKPDAHTGAVVKAAHPVIRKALAGADYELAVRR